jgi:serine/threonine protein phosphatase PrpC
MRSHNKARSDTGLVRDHNEDGFFADDARGIYAIADGMGGHAAGEVASKAAVDAIAAARPEGDVDPPSWVPVAARAAARAVWEAAHGNKEREGMGTTMTLVAIGADGRATVAHVGDSRMYRLRDGKIAQITKDHTYAEEMAEMGIVSREQARKGPFGHSLTRCVGHDPDVPIDVFEIQLVDGDRLLLCTDGLSDHLSQDDDLLESLHGELDEASASLVDFANASGGDDNVTVVLVDIVDGDDSLCTTSELIGTQSDQPAPFPVDYDDLDETILGE